ncbi:sugar-binding domain-containing protein [soil metagenome]
MTERTPLAPTGLTESLAAAQVARRFYFSRQSKAQIAADLGLSRFKVSRLLEFARSRDIVRITVNEPGSIDTELSAQLRETFGLRHVIVAHAANGDDEGLRDQLGQVAAQLLEEITGPDDVVGLGWARAVLSMASHVKALKARRIVQLSGALTRPDVELSAIDLVRAIGARAEAETSVFYSPMLVSDTEAAQALLRQEQVADTFAAFPTVTVAVVGVGGWNPAASTLHEALSPHEQEEMRNSTVRADLSGILLDVDGHVVHAPISDRLIAIPADELHDIPDVIGLAYGLEKVPAARAAIRGGYITSLVTEHSFAQCLLSD